MCDCFLRSYSVLITRANVLLLGRMTMWSHLPGWFVSRHYMLGSVTLLNYILFCYQYSDDHSTQEHPSSQFENLLYSMIQRTELLLGFIHNVAQTRLSSRSVPSTLHTTHRRPGVFKLFRTQVKGQRLLSVELNYFNSFTVAMMSLKKLVCWSP